ncbi:DUF1150 domain-containing protein [Aestuariispira ectoiniformans]|mgnify:CR=1 FL=1|uniref:DUF1150 domain-containing protein n=1 Tax=Aestuariispira ectoiniformans TaxID=2775080 RepID=UPI00223B2B09|nr:DUF1150 domain-containing protein [Aestuariispira ectoiniformans]
MSRYDDEFNWEDAVGEDAADLFDLKSLSEEEFAELGMESIGYIKPVSMPEGIRFRITTADGQAVAEAENYDAACMALEHFELEAATLH